MSTASPCDVRHAHPGTRHSSCSFRFWPQAPERHESSEHRQVGPAEKDQPKAQTQQKDARLNRVSDDGKGPPLVAIYPDLTARAQRMLAEIQSARELLRLTPPRPSKTTLHVNSASRRVANWAASRTIANPEHRSA